MNYAKDNLNIILISLDAVRADHLACYGYWRDTTPFLNELVKSAVVYEYAYTPARWTLPAHASLFTGTSNSKHGVAADWTNLKLLEDESTITLAEFLNGLGYQTAAFASIDYLGNLSKLDRGFEHFSQAWTLLDPSNNLYDPIKNLSNKFKKDWIWRINHIYERSRSDKGARRINRMFKSWLKKRSQSKPFFAFLHYLEAHARYWPPKPFRSEFVAADSRAETISEKHKGCFSYLTGKQFISPEEFNILAGLYDGELLYLDRILEDLVGFLEDCKLLDETMIIITSDHGECFGEHGHYQHSSPCLHEPAIRVPLIIRFPEIFPAYDRVKIPVSTIDIYPTIVDFISNGRNKIIEQFQGESLFPTHLKQRANNFVVVESLTTPESGLRAANPNIDITGFDYFLRAIRWRNYKYIWHSQGDHELYDLSIDPDEGNNLINSEPSIRDILQAHLEQWLASFAPNQKQYEDGLKIDPEVLRRLADLGYV